jgi:hypothetical protein
MYPFLPARTKAKTTPSDERRDAPAQGQRT